MFETDPTARHDELRTAGVDLVAIGGSKHEFEAEAVDKVIRGIGSGPHDFGTIVERAVLRKVEHDLNTAVGNSVMQGTAGWPFCQGSFSKKRRARLEPAYMWVNRS